MSTVSLYHKLVSICYHMFYQMSGSLSTDAALHCAFIIKSGMSFTRRLTAEDILMESLLEDKARDSFTFFFSDFHKEATISH